MNLLLIGGSSFIGKNLIRKAPSSWKIKASYCNSKDFKNFIATYPNVNAFHLDLKENNVPQFEEVDVVLYFPTMTPGQLTGHQEQDARVMYRLHAQGVSMVAQKIKICKKFIYFSSGIFYLEGDYSDYRKSKLLGEANLQAISTKKGFPYLIARNMEIYGLFMAKHKIYRRLSEACLRGENEFHVAGDGLNLLDTMYIDDYIDILIKIIKSDVKNEIFPMSKSDPVTLRELTSTISKVYDHKTFKLVCAGQATEHTDFTLNNQKMVDLFGLSPQIDLEEGLQRWKNVMFSHH